MPVGGAYRAWRVDIGGLLMLLVLPLTTFAAPPPLVSVLLPVFNGSDVLSETLACVREQTHPNIELLIGIDKSADSATTAAIVERFADAAPWPVRIFDRPQHVGFVENINDLIRAVNGDFWCVQPHDDLVPPDYIATLLQCLIDHPAVVNCFPRNELFGRDKRGVHSGSRRMPSILGASASRRIHAAMQATYSQPFRGLVRNDRRLGRAKHPFLLMPVSNDFCSTDMVQIVQFAALGELIEANVTYRKRMSPYSHHNKQLFQADHFGWEKRLAGVLDASVNLFNLGVPYADDADTFVQECAQYAARKAQMHRNLLRKLGAPAPPHVNVRQAFLDRIAAQTNRVAILGGGWQGCLIALALARRGLDVTILEKESDVMARSAIANEGKVHLGFVYSKDRSMSTANLMLKHALHFANDFEDIVGVDVDWQALKSEPFSYLVPFASYLNADELARFFGRVENAYNEMLLRDPSLNYLGAQPAKLFRRVPLPSGVNKTFFSAAFETEEYSVEPFRMADIVRSALRRENVRTLTGVTVRKVERMRQAAFGRFRVESSRGRHIFDSVVNCMWEGRFAVDQQMNVGLWAGADMRFKFGVFMPPIAELDRVPTATLVNGLFGDFVRYKSRNNSLYFSWYPESRAGIQSASKPINATWDQWGSGNLTDAVRSELLFKHEAMLNTLFPHKRHISIPAGSRVVGGFIVGSGRTDISDTASELHGRNDTTILAKDGYFSIATQKYTFAPHIAKQFEKRFLDTMNI